MHGAPAADRPAYTPALLIFLPFAAGYFLSYLFRSVNAVISSDLVGEFDLSASDLGLLTSAYFLAFASLQIPIGLMLDRFGPRRTNALLLLCAGSGAVVFAHAHGLSGLLIGRAMIGFGVAACLMSSIKVFTLWFPLERLPALNGRMMFIGGLGAISATVPVETALRVTDWRGLFLALAACTLAAAAVVFFVVPEKPGARPHEPLRSQLRGTIGVFASSAFWRLALGTTLMQAFNMSVQGLWAGPWLAHVAGLERDAVALHLLALGIATMCGFLLWGALAERLARRGVSPMSVLIVASACFLVVQALLVFGVSRAPMSIWVAWGLFGTSGSLSFAILSQRFPIHLSGRATTALNLLVFSLAFTSQWGFGVIVNRWPAPGGGYQAHGYAVAFAVFLCLQLAGFVWMVTGGRRSGVRA